MRILRNISCFYVHVYPLENNIEDYGVKHVLFSKIAFLFFFISWWKVTPSCFSWNRVCVKELFFFLPYFTKGKWLFHDMWGALKTALILLPFKWTRLLSFPIQIYKTPSTLFDSVQNAQFSYIVPRIPNKRCFIAVECLTHF